MVKTSFYCDLLFWMAFPGVLALGTSIICSRIPGLSPKQRRICESRPDAMAVVGDAERMALAECRHQFQYQRWNCSYMGANETSIGLILPKTSKTKEIAFYYALRSAAVAHALATACSQGTLSGCGCDRSKLDGQPVHSDSNKGRKSFENQEGGKGKGETGIRKWGGCSVDIKHAVSFAKTFLDATETEENSRTLMNRHNNRVGRKILTDSVKTTCRCNGVSGSCLLRICWRTLQPFRMVGDRLMERYKTPRSIRQVQGLKGLSRARHPRYLKLKRAKQVDKKPSRRHLVYLNHSPSYCDFDPHKGSLGTRGRTCNRSDDAVGSCAVMCCGRGYSTKVQRRTWKCNCTFHWCCTVTCQQCNQDFEEYICN